MPSKISLTTDTWQASNTDGYLAVMAHWIEVRADKSWHLNSALLGFTKLNNAHNSVRLGQALYKIVNWVAITHKVNIPLIHVSFVLIHVWTDRSSKLSATT